MCIRDSSNTGGQASKASNIGEVCQFAAAGKEVGKKSLAEIAMSYGYVYVAQIALGANPAQAVKVISEAESYNGPSLIIGYAPCELHGIAQGGMNHCQDEMKTVSYTHLDVYKRQLCKLIPPVACLLIRIHVVVLYLAEIPVPVCNYCRLYTSRLKLSPCAENLILRICALLMTAASMY